MHDECQKTEIIGDLKKNVESLNDMKSAVVELKTIVAMLLEQSKKQDELIKQQSDTLIRINDTVASHSVLIAQLASQQSEYLKEGSIKYTQILQMVISRYLPPVILAGITYYILQIIAK